MKKRLGNADNGTATTFWRGNVFHCIVCGAPVSTRTHLYRTISLCGWRCGLRFDRDPLVFMPLELELIEY